MNRVAVGLSSICSLFACVCLLEGCTGEVRTGVTSNGLYYEVSGAGEPVVLLHGFSLDRRSWDREEAWLRPDFTVIRYDLRGHGRSDPWTDPFYAHADLLTVLDELGVADAALVGLSAGAQIAIDFALDYPDRVRSLVLVSPGLGGFQPVGSFDWMSAVMEALQDGDARTASQLWADTPLMKVESDPVTDSVMREIVTDNWAIWTYDRQLQQTLTPLAVKRLSEIRVPTLVVTGERDLVDTHRVADTLVVCLPNARLIEAPGAGHLVNLEAPELFREVTSAFLREVSRSPASSTTKRSC